jgi:hypothetical protein
LTIRCWLFFSFFVVATAAQTPEELFSAKVLPVLERDCQGCHGAAQALSNFDVRTREALLKGGLRGASLVPGKADTSLLMHAIEGRNKLQMPPGKPLAPDVIAAFRTWIDKGAPWPEKTRRPNGTTNRKISGPFSRCANSTPRSASTTSLRLA